MPRRGKQLGSTRGQAHHVLGHVLWRRDDLDGAVDAFRTGVVLSPGAAADRVCLGNALRERGDPTNAIPVFEESIRIQPALASAHRSLGLALIDARQEQRAVAACREAVRLAPKDAESHAALGFALRALGQLADASLSFKTAAELSPTSVQIRSQLRLTEHWIGLDHRLPDLLAGRAQPASPVEAVEFAELCRQPFRKRYDFAVHLYRAAFAAEPKLLTSASRYAAVCAAVELGAGNDPSVRIGEEEWHQLQRYARAWLTADLTAAAKLEGSGTPAERQSVRRKLAAWHRSRDLATVRDDAFLASMPPDERVAWQAFWREVAVVGEMTRPPLAPVPRVIDRSIPTTS